MKNNIRHEDRLELSFSVIVEPDEAGFYAHCPALKGIHVDGKTEREALDRAIEAAECYFKSMTQRKETFPVGLAVRHTSRSHHVHAKRYEVQWPSLRTCGVS